MPAGRSVTLYMQLKAGMSQHTDAGVSCQPVHVLFVLICQLVGRKLVFSLLNVVGLDHSAEDWKAVLDVQ